MFNKGDNVSFKVEINTWEMPEFNNAVKALWKLKGPNNTDPDVDPATYWPTAKEQGDWWLDWGIKMLPEVPADFTFKDGVPFEWTHLEFADEAAYKSFVDKWAS